MTIVNENCALCMYVFGGPSDDRSEGEAERQRGEMGMLDGDDIDRGD